MAVRAGPPARSRSRASSSSAAAITLATWPTPGSGEAPFSIPRPTARPTSAPLPYPDGREPARVSPGLLWVALPHDPRDPNGRSRNSKRPPSTLATGFGLGSGPSSSSSSSCSSSSPDGPASEDEEDDEDEEESGPDLHTQDPRPETQDPPLATALESAHPAAGAASLLRRCPAFAELPEAELAQLAAQFEARSYPLGHTICTAEEPADAFYLIASGRVRVVVENREGQRVTLFVLGAGQHFGEESMQEGGRYGATVRAASEVAVLRLEGRRFAR